VRIPFKHVGHANCYLKTCKRILANNLIGPDGEGSLLSGCATLCVRA
jgi:hypothetical protein